MREASVSFNYQFYQSQYQIIKVTEQLQQNQEAVGMWERMINFDLFKVKGPKKEDCSNSRILNKRTGHFHPLEKQNLNNQRYSLRTESSPIKLGKRQRQYSRTIQTEGQQLNEGPYFNNITFTQPQLQILQKPGRVIYGYKRPEEGEEWMRKAIQYKNELQTYKSKLSVAEYQLINAQNQSNMLLELQKIKYEKRIEELKNKLVDRDKEIRQKDELIKNFIQITRTL